MNERTCHPATYSSVHS